MILDLSDFDGRSARLVLLGRGAAGICDMPPCGGNVFTHVVNNEGALRGLASSSIMAKVRPVVREDAAASVMSVSSLGAMLRRNGRLFACVSFRVSSRSPIYIRRLFTLVGSNGVRISCRDRSFLNFCRLTHLRGPGRRAAGESEKAVAIEGRNMNIKGLFVCHRGEILDPARAAIKRMIGKVRLVSTTGRGRFVAIGTRRNELVLLGGARTRTARLLSTTNIRRVVSKLMSSSTVVIRRGPRRAVSVLGRNGIVAGTVGGRRLYAVGFISSTPESMECFGLLANLLRGPINRLGVRFTIPKVRVIVFRKSGGTTGNLIPRGGPISGIVENRVKVAGVTSGDTNLVNVEFRSGASFKPATRAFRTAGVVNSVASSCSRLRGLGRKIIICIARSGGRS